MSCISERLKEPSTHIDKHQIGQRIALLRTERGISQETLAMRLRCTKQTISNYERDLRRPAYETLQAIADALSVPITFFLSRELEQDMVQENPSKRIPLGEIISNYRREHNLSQRQFAEICGGITNGYISMLENNRNPSTDKPIVPSLDKLKAIARGMNVSLQRLLDLTDGLQDALSLETGYMNLFPIDQAYMQMASIKADAVLCVDGNSMDPQYINGDMVFIRYQDDVADGQIAAVSIENTVTLKKIYHIPNGVCLVSENTEYPPITCALNGTNNIHIVGLAVGYMRWNP